MKTVKFTRTNDDKLRVSIAYETFPYFSTLSSIVYYADAVSSCNASVDLRALLGYIKYTDVNFTNVVVNNSRMFIRVLISLLFSSVAPVLPRPVF